MAFSGGRGEANSCLILSHGVFSSPSFCPAFCTGFSEAEGDTSTSEYWFRFFGSTGSVLVQYWFRFFRPEFGLYQGFYIELVQYWFGTGSSIHAFSEYWYHWFTPYR